MKSLGQYADVELATLAREVRAERLSREGRVQNCQKCGSDFFARADANYCSGRCRTAAYRLRQKAAYRLRLKEDS